MTAESREIHHQADAAWLKGHNATIAWLRL